MDANRWKRIKEVYDRALDLGGEERDGFLAEACGDDDDLRREVKSLLAAHDDAGSFLQSPAVEVAAREIVGDEVTSPTLQLIGRELANYKIISLLGRGGMGEVYLAEDKRLRRKVALKLLPARFTNDAERAHRFEREAKAASATNHPNILTIYEIGQADGLRFIATEFVDGVTLRQAMQNDGMSVAESLSVAIQVASALSAAHEAGIIHRDIKPENVMVRRDGIVKVLDFGLAKLKPQQNLPVDSQAATQRKITDPGTVMGTVGYMSPEQVRGQEADTRSDIFSFGMILYEMLSGKRAFNGASVADVMSAILKEDPPELGETNAKISPALEKIVRRCLEKKPERRFQTASDLGFALEALSAPSGSRLETAVLPAVAENAVASAVRKRERLAWLVAALSLGMLGFAWAYFTRQPASDARVFKTSILPPEKSSFGQIAVSPDGRHLAFTAATGGNVQLWVRPLDSTEARPLAGTQGAIFPFWSPDSRFIGFFADGRLKKIEFTGGPALTLCEAPRTVTGGAWSRAGVILFGQIQIGLLRVSATGGEVTRVTSSDRSRRETSHRYPTFLPDGHHFLYAINTGQKETRGVYLGSLDGTVKRRLLDDSSVIKYVAAYPGDRAGGGGWLIFGRDGALLARPFDTSLMEFTGEPFSLSDKVGSDLGSANDFTFSVSDNGVLVFDPNPNRHRRLYRWMDRRGQPINSPDVPAGYFQHWLSPDEKRFIAERPYAAFRTSDLWLYDVSGGSSARFTFDPATDISPVWSPDGSRIVWASSRDGIANLYQKAASGAGEDALLLKSDHPKYPTDWSRDGRFIIYRQDDPKTKSDVWFLPVTGSSEAKPPFPVIQTEANEITGTLSPDGRWLAYASDVSGQYEVYVQSYPESGGKRQVSTGGGSGPRWRRDGRELFYYARNGKLMAAPVRSGESFEVGSAVSLFEFRSGTVQAFYAPYAVTADGQRF
ncbi:MAG: protein kinase [Blastocatellales bacterium]